MNIMETIARFNALHKAERDALDTLGNDPATIDSYLKTAGESNRFFAENWPLVSVELKRLQADNDALRSRLVDAEYNAETGFAQGVHDERCRQQAAVEKAREILGASTLMRVKDHDDPVGLMRGFVKDALTALDGLARDAGDGWISVNDRLPAASGFDRYERLIQKPILVSTDKGQVFETIFILGGFANLKNRGNVAHWRPLPAAPKGGA